MNYIPINIKTNYELLNSLIKIDDLISYALKNNISALAITDSNMHGTIEFYNKCKTNNIMPIIGITLELENIKFNLYAKNYEGYINLCKIVSIKNTKGLSFEDLTKLNQNLISVLYNESKEYFSKLSKIYQTIFLSYKNTSEKTEALLVTSNIVYMNQILYFEEKDSEYLKYLIMIKENKTISEDYQFLLTDNYFIKEIDEQDASTTKIFEELIDIEFPHPKFKLPVFDKTIDSKEYFRSLCKAGLSKRLNQKVTKKYVDRLIYEIEIIEKMGFVDYFLIVYDFIKYAKKNQIIVGPGRGSAAGSLVSYVLGITEIDPLKYNLIFERFLNPERITMPDIDIDFEYLKRDQVVLYVKNKYGHENVANIITFGTLLPKAVIRDVARVLEIDLSVVDKICKTIKHNESFKELENNSNFNSLINTDKLKKLIRISKKLEGLKRHTSIHAAGVIISDEALYNKIPLYKSGDNLLTGYSMEYLEELGLLKIDFLALRNLTIIENIISLVEKEKNIKINLNQINFDDKKTLELFYNVDTVGIFQFESSGMRNFLRKLKINDFETLVAAIALYRPGPRENIDSFIRRKEGREKIDYIIPELEPILKSTYGIIIYQEQILEILRVVAGYSYSEADNIRRAMSKKKEDIIKNEKQNFINKSIEKGISIEKANLIYELVLKFANYGFNKSHSVAYSIVAFWMGYLKTHYKQYFLANLLNIVISSEEKTKEYIDEARTLGINVVSPYINKSDYYYKVKNNDILIPLSIIKNVGREATTFIINERKNGEYIDFFDFVRRVYTKQVNLKTIESLILSGALSSFGYNKKTLISTIENAINYTTLCKDLDLSLVEKPEILILEDFTEEELMNIEYEIFGFYIKNHPVTKYKRENVVLLKDVENYFDKIITTIVLVEKIKTINTKDNEKMSFLTISDEYKKIEAVMFPKIFEKFYNIEKGNILKIFGKVEKRMDIYQIVINDLQIL